LGDFTKMKELLNFEPRYSLEAGLLKFIEWYKRRQELKVL